MTSQSNRLHDPYKPFRGIVLIPSDGIAVIHGELVVEIMVTLANCHKSSSEVVSWCVLIIERSLSKPVSK